ncbi:hypothetical protein EVAR_38040_1 [Eumeta japonica]|uniref:Uncharacterized protein n=1 Tax=Eumeta variegata TaxID=151549 RepID=A0A4C1W7D8_EUMVA|nr:hypothetical protein EVAR_38040_1 [Eumeta japonica]
MPHAVRKVHKFLQRHIIGTAKVYDRPTQTQINAHLEGCSKAKKVKCSQPSKMPRRITTKKKAVTKGVQSYAAPTTITRSAQLNLPVTSPMIGPTNNLRERLGQPMAVNEMNTQKRRGRGVRGKSVCELRVDWVGGHNMERYRQ